MDLLEKIKSKKARVGIIGLGYVGLPLAVGFCRAGFRVSGFDTDEDKISLLEQGRSYISYIEDSHVARCGPLFRPTSDFSALPDMDCIVICLPTPLNKYKEPDLSFVFNTAEIIAGHLRAGQLVVLESTTYPGTTDEDLRSILEGSGLKAGEDFHLAYSPERVDPGSRGFGVSSIPKIVGGYSEGCLSAAKALYDFVDDTVAVSSTKVAEAAKLLENIYRAVNIALVNELKMLFERMDIDIWEVIDAAKTKPFGFQAFYPGPGLGGHCIPIDPFYLTFKARQYDFSTRFIGLAGEINTNMPYYVVGRAVQVLNGAGKAPSGSRVLVLGVAYKKDVNDTRESPALKIIHLLKEHGAGVSYNDPLVPVCKGLRHYPGMVMESVELTEETLGEADLTILVTDHTEYDYAYIEKHARLILDTRDGFRRNGIKSLKVHRA